MPEATNDTSRIYYDDETKQNLDEHLEVVFYEVFHEKISDKNAIAQLLDPYAVEVNGEKAVMFLDALDNEEHAKKWASQYGSVRIESADDYDIEPVPGHENREIKWVVSCGDGGKVATARILSHAIVLAGVQWLRMIASSVLNSNDTGSSIH